MKVVFDTNILVSAVLWRGTPYRCLLTVQAGLAELIVSPSILTEFHGVLVAKFAFTEAEAAETIALVRNMSTHIEVPGVLEAVADDPEDDKFIETAQLAGAPYLVSGDKHLLRLATYGSVQIIRARAFLDMLTREQA